MVGRGEGGEGVEGGMGVEGGWRCGGGVKGGGPGQNTKSDF